MHKRCPTDGKWCRRDVFQLVNISKYACLLRSAISETSKQIPVPELVHHGPGGVSVGEEPFPSPVFIPGPGTLGGKVAQVLGPCPSPGPRNGQQVDGEEAMGLGVQQWVPAITLGSGCILLTTRSVVLEFLKLKNFYHTKWWWGCEVTRTLMCCWSECKMSQALLKTVG